MNNLTTEQVVTTVRHTKRLTKRGKAVIAIAYATGTIMAGVFLANCFLDGLEAEGRMRDAQSAPYIKAIQEKEDRHLRQ